MRRRYLSIYIDTYTGYIGSASQFEHYPASRSHRFKFVGYHKRVPSVSGRIMKSFIKRHGLNIEIRPLPRKRIMQTNNDEDIF